MLCWSGHMRRAGIYARVSTIDQSGGLAVQLEQLRRYAEARGLQFVEYVDKGLSGTRRDRPGLQGLLEAARRRAIDVVICTKFDRLFRSVRHLTAVVGELKELGVDLVVFDQQIDTTTAMGRLFFHVTAAFGEFEGDLIRERVTAGVRHARARRRRWGRPLEMVVDVPRARELQAQGRSLRAIARELRAHPTQVRRALDRASQNLSPEPPPNSAT